jgi:hypothetical protein
MARSRTEIDESSSAEIRAGRVRAHPLPGSAWVLPGDGVIGDPRTAGHVYMIGRLWRFPFPVLAGLKPSRTHRTAESFSPALQTSAMPHSGRRRVASDAEISEKWQEPAS